MKFVKYTSAALICLYTLTCIAAFVFQRSLLFFPPAVYLSPADLGVDTMQEITFNVNGTAATSWWHPPEGEDNKTVLFFHGNGSAVYSNYNIFADLIASGHGVLSVGYPGYPHADMATDTRKSAPSQALIVKAAVQNYDYVIGQNIDLKKIVYFGTSIGTGAAAQLTASHPPSLLILDAPFNSTLDMARLKLPFLPSRLLMKDTFESAKALKGSATPLIWTHGTLDKVIPLAQGQKLYDSYNGPKSAHIITGGRHTNLWGLGGREIVLGALEP